jgi:hypothetical protein
MKSGDRAILLVIPLLAAVVGLWLLVIGPKRQDAAAVEAKTGELQSALTVAEAEVAAGEEAQTSFRHDYADLVSLGAAAPEDGGQASLIYDVSSLGQDNDVHFRAFTVTQGSGVDVAPPTTTAATPVEATVATLPIGATVGPAGLPMMPYDFKFLGNFFSVADFFADLDDQVEVKAVTTEVRTPSVSGRLLTINGFALTAHPALGFPDVQADFSVSSYVVPADQGIDGGATPASPAPVAVADAAVAPATTTPAATVTP